MQAQDSSNNYICKNNNWMQKNRYIWYLSPDARALYAGYVWYVSGGGSVSSSTASVSYGVVPSLYLKSNVLIESGNGSESNPYILKAGV